MLVMAFGSLTLGALPASAVEINTDYPVLDVQAGQSVSLDLNLTTKSAESVKLSIAHAPDNWQTSLQGGGFTIGGVYVTPKSSSSGSSASSDAPSVQLHIQVPATAKAGKYHVTVDADAPSGNKTLDVEVDVVKHASNAYQLTSQFSKLQGAASDTFNFTLTLKNNTGKDASFGLTAQGPQGWTVTASPSQQQKASAVDVKAGESSTVDVKATLPSKAKAGKYPIVVAANGQGVTLKKKLSVQVVGSPKLDMATANQVLNASGSAGDTTDVHLTLTNSGSAPLQGVSLSSSPPSNWKVSFSPKDISAIQPGRTVDVVAHVTPAGDAITGDYQVSLSANSNAANSSVNLRYTVNTSSWWGLVGIIIIIIVIIALLWLFRRYGRR